jgi:hypothetical protein
MEKLKKIFIGMGNVLAPGLSIDPKLLEYRFPIIDDTSGVSQDWENVGSYLREAMLKFGRNHAEER